MPQQPQQNFDAMRQDAIRRSREMQRRAMPPQQQHRPPEPPPEPNPPESPQKPPLEQPTFAEKPHREAPAGGGSPLPEELSGLLTDWNGEKIALAGLLYLLYKEGADVSLLLALAYILL